MIKTNQTFKELIEDRDLTFLVGAGCSIDAPSCLPAGREMMQAIIKYSCAESEQEKLLSIKELRFEQLVEIIRDQLDPKLNIIDFYGECDKSNLQHFYLSEMLKKGHYVMTTNFDFLIEYALMQSGVPHNEIVPVITKKDFENNSDPTELFNKGKKVLYKIHGSTKNIITKESTKDSLIATIEAFGSGKEGESVFQVEPFKRPLFENISNNRTLIVLGYSGSDDFDIVPTLKVLKNLKNIIWIDYIPDDGGKERVYEINNEDIKIGSSDKITQILIELFRMQNVGHIYRTEANTTKLLERMLDFKPPMSKEQFSISLRSWFENNIKSPDEFIKHSIPYKIYIDFDMHKDALRCSKTILSLAEKKDSLMWKSISLNNIGDIYQAHGMYAQALEQYQEALKIDEQRGSLSGKAIVLSNIGGIYSAQGNYTEALKQYQESLKIDEQLRNLSGKAAVINNIGLIHKSQGNYTEALKQYQEALMIDEQLGNLSGKSVRLNNIGELFYRQSNYSEALKRYEESLKIDEQLGNISGKASSLSNIGEIYKIKGDYAEALRRYEESLRIDEQLGNLAGKAIDLSNIGDTYRIQGKFSEALKRFYEALNIDVELGDLAGKAIDLNNIGGIYRLQGNYPEAQKYFLEALGLNEQIGDLAEQATCLNNIGEIYRIQGNYSEALRKYEQALKIDEELGNLSGKAIRINNIGEIYNIQKNYHKALLRYQEALKIDDQLGDLSNKAIDLNNIRMLYDDQGNFLEAMKYLEQSLQILFDLGLDSTPNAITTKKKIENLRNKLK